MVRVWADRGLGSTEVSGGKLLGVWKTTKSSFSIYFKTTSGRERGQNSEAGVGAAEGF